MNRRRLTTLAATLLMGLCAIAPTAGARTPAGSVTKSSGTVSATLSWKSGQGNAISDPRLKVSRAGVVVTDLSVANVCNSCRLVEDAPDATFSVLHVDDLDADGEPEVLFDAHSGGAHCCVTTRFFNYRPASNSYMRARSQYWGNAGYEVEDLDGDGRLELSGSDDVFDSAFAAFAASAFPPKIIRYTRNASTGSSTLTDVTRRFPAVIRADAARLLKLIRKARPDPRTFQTQGRLAAYVADQYLLGKGSVGKAELPRARRRGLTTPGFQTDLLKFLGKHGYR